MIDMGKSKHGQLWYTGGRSIRELLEAGDIIAVPDGNSYCYKRTERASELEKAAALSVSEIEELENAS